MRPFALAALVVLTLAACAPTNSIRGALDSRPNPGPCPTIGGLYQASRVVKLAGDSVTYGNISYTGEIIGTRLYCRYADDEPIVAELEIDFAFGKGPAGEARKHTYDYFVAVMRRNSRVLEKKVFSVEADFGTGLIDANSQLIRQVVIPRLDESISGVNFEVLVGFDLTEEEREFNQSGQRFRLDAEAGARSR